MQKMQVWSLGLEDPLEEDMATHSSILAWEIPWTEEPDRPQFLGRKELDMTEQLSTYMYMLTWNSMKNNFTAFTD